MGLNFSLCQNESSPLSADETTILPPEMIEEIASYLSINDIITCREVSTSWRNFIDSTPRTLKNEPLFLILNKRSSESLMNGFRERFSKKWNRLCFEKIKITHKTYNCLKANSESVEELKFMDCSGPDAPTARNENSSWSVTNVLTSRNENNSSNFRNASTSGNENTSSNVREASTAKNENTSWNNLSALKICPKLKKLSIVSSISYYPHPGLLDVKYFDDFYQHFFLRNLTHLDLSYNRISDNILFQFLCEIDNLVSLNLSGLDFSFTNTDKALDSKKLNFKVLYDSYLSTPKAKNLKSLYLNETEISFHWIKKLANTESLKLSSISLLNLTKWKNDSEGRVLSAVLYLLHKKFGNLKELRLSLKKNVFSNGIELELSPDDLKKFKDIEVLKIEFIIVTSRSEFFQSLFSVKNLSIKDSKEGADSMYPFLNQLPNPQNLKHLKMEICNSSVFSEHVEQLTSESLECFGLLTNLTSLKLDTSDLTPHLSDSLLQIIISNLPLLHTLDLKFLRNHRAREEIEENEEGGGDIEIGPTDLGVAGMLVDEYEDACEYEIGGRILKYQKESYKKYANVADDESSHPKRLSLSSLKYLKRLSLVNCWLLGMGSFKYGLNIPGLEHLDLTMCRGLGKEGMEQIVTNCPRITHLNISYCFNVIYNPEARTLLKSLKRLREFKALSMEEWEEENKHRFF